MVQQPKNINNIKNKAYVRVTYFLKEGLNHFRWTEYYPQENTNKEKFVKVFLIRVSGLRSIKK
jgi:hypothetical protein